MMLGPGEGFAFLSAISFAVASVAVAKSSGAKSPDAKSPEAKSPDAKSPDASRGDNGAMLSVFITAAAASAIWGLSHVGQPMQVTGSFGPGLAWFALSGLLTMVFGRALLFRSIVSLGAVRATAVKRLNPFFSVLLAALVLGEAISLQAAFGMALIGASFLLLIRRSLMAHAGRQAAAAQAAGPAPVIGQAPARQAPAGAAPAGPAPAALLAYSYGPGSALAYAFGYIARKFGLLDIPDSNFGTFVGAAAALLSYLLGALVIERYRQAILGMFSNATLWQVAAALFISVGQLSQFAAIKYIEVSRVVMIVSLDIFIAMFLAVYVVRTERRPDGPTLAAAALAAVGVVVVAAS